MVDRRAESVLRRSRFWLWTIFLTSLALIGLGKPVYDLHWRNLATIWAQSSQKEQAARSLARADIHTRLVWVKGERPREAERMMGLPRGYLGVVPADGRASVLVLGEALGPSREGASSNVLSFPMRASAAGWTIELNFRDGRVVAGRALAPPPTSSPPRPWLWNATDLAVRLMLLVGPLAWLGGLLAGLIERTRGTRAGEVALAGALAGSVAWTVQPNVLFGHAGWVGMALGGFMIFAAVAMIRWLGRIARSRQFHFCYQCGYDLTGNTSGVCPECGNETHEGVIRKKSEEAEAMALAIAAAASADELGSEDGPDSDVGDDREAFAEPLQSIAAEADLAYFEEAATVSSASRAEAGAGAGE